MIFRYSSVLLLLILTFLCGCREKVSADLPSGDTTRAVDTLQIISTPVPFYLEGEIRPNQGLFQALGDLNVSTPIALKIVNNLRFEVELTNLRAGERLKVKYSADSATVLEFVYEPNPIVDHILTLDTITNEYAYTKDEIPADTTYRLIVGTIKQGSTLDAALKEMDVPPSLVQVVNGILLCKISFRTSARAGDTFTVTLREDKYNGEWISGSVMHASYNGRVTGFHEAFRYYDPDPQSTYNAHYTIKGEALVHTGLRYPVDRLHISSSYGYRVHPVTGRTQMHYGVDYKGNIGAPVYAVAKGVVTVSAYDRYSGNKIAIRHSDKSKSYYLHLNARAVSPGSHVRTGQVIGRVGRTGRVTGPHLHFGFKAPNGRWMNPLKKRMIATPKLTGGKYELLKSQIKITRATTERLRAEDQIASLILYLNSF